jgi:hypothetical protein
MKVKALIYRIISRLANWAGYEIDISRKSASLPIPKVVQKSNTPDAPILVLPQSIPVQPTPISNDPKAPYHEYCQDGLMSTHNNDFLTDERFVKAYRRGIKAAHGIDYQWQWRVYVGLWAAQTCSRLEGDYIECGVGNGFLSSAIMEYLGWNELTKNFYLFDTFEGLDERFVNPEELTKMGSVESFNMKMLNAGTYTKNYQSVEENFREWDRVNLIRGAIPETLMSVSIARVAYLHIDINCAAPEIAAIDHFYPRLSMGGVILLDDYAYCGYDEQKKAMDNWASRNRVGILSLPTGQGMLLKTNI